MMPTQTSLPKVQLQHNKMGDLDTFTIHGNGFRAVVLKQGAQLIHFMTADEDNPFDLSANWLWVSDNAEYHHGESVRGGVPICWPVFGQFAANPKAVQDSFVDMDDMPQHGFGRLQPFELDSFSVEDTDKNAAQTATLILTLDDHKIDDTFASAPNLALKVVFNFSQQGFAIELITQNHSDNTVTFSQALHTYLPTDDISQTSISGFDGLTYSDTLTGDTVDTVDQETNGWQTKTQQGNITFDEEVDRIYHAAPTITLNSPAQTYHLYADGSNSTVVWNPWIDKSKQISQFSQTDYQRMLCIETANAHLDVVKLGAGAAWRMGMRLHCSIKTESS